MHVSVIEVFIKGSIFFVKHLNISVLSFRVATSQFSALGGEAGRGSGQRLLALLLIV